MSKQITTKLRGFSLDFFSFRCGQRLRVWSKHHFELKQMQQTMCRMFCVAYFSLQTNLFKHVVFLHVVRKTIEKPSAVDAMNDWSSGACVCPEAFGANRKSENVKPTNRTQIVVGWHKGYRQISVGIERCFYLPTLTYLKGFCKKLW